MLRVLLGVGNPGPEYAPTRHNVGFRVVDALAAAGGRRTAKLRDLAAEGIGVWVGGAPLLLVKPLTYVNRCGAILAAIRDLEEVPLDRTLVVVDDIHLPLGRVRLRARGSDGGHNGLRSLSEALGRDDYPRLRLGIGSPAGAPLERYVLQPFPPGERTSVDAMVARAARAVALWVSLGAEQAMGEVNRPDLDPPDPRA